MSPWAQFIQYGPGEPEDRNQYNVSWCDNLSIRDLGEVPTRLIQLGEYTDAAGPWNLRVYANTAVNETPGLTMNVQGMLGDEMVRTEVDGVWIDGENISITSGSSYVQSAMQFDTITAVVKPVTNGYVRLAAWNGTVEIDLSNYEPSETNPSYHRYYSAWLHRLQANDERLRKVRARCRRRFVPIAQDNDELTITNINALKAGLIGQWKRDAGNLEQAEYYMGKAIQILEKEAKAYRGKAKLPAISYQYGTPMGAVFPVR
jgi:hypothetical protein